MVLFWLFVAQATTGKQGVLGPTKIYLAVQPAVNANQTANSSTGSTTDGTPIKQEPQEVSKTSSNLESSGK